MITTLRPVLQGVLAPLPPGSFADGNTGQAGIEIQQAIQNVFATGLYDGQMYTKYVTGDTKLSSIRNKAIFVIENNPELNLSTGNNGSNTPDIYSWNFYNSLSNTVMMTKGTYLEMDPNSFIATPPKSTGSMTTDSNTFHMVLPNNNTSSQSNVNVFSSIQDYGVQITAFQYYVADQNLMEYEKLFKTYGFAFVPMSFCLSYIQNYAMPEDLKKSGILTILPKWLQ